MKIFLTSLLLVAMFDSYSQTIDNFSIDSGGAVSSNGGISLIYTIGEIAIDEPTAGNINLSSGFINGSYNETVTAIEGYSSSESRILIHPNPASECVHIETTLIIDHLELYNSLGHKVKHQNNFSGCLDVSTLNSGLYILKIVARDLELFERILINN